ncbi:4Fe-4S dicluster domain-containing protein [Pseudonocardia asaccharolytica]|uniref:4Fe-4S dicluster domain-containing protein n=2 Tax=Pseudonocardia asaccharolytica TaxID=54010 RepID=UPI001FE202DB
MPVGQFRTWVKYVDQGTFPDSTRDFGVMRCNHCTDAPCVKICPTKALFVRDDGIVDFDRDRCIGCKSCMQGCPYDAIYIDEDTHTAAKCNFCAHRIDQDKEPACVVVCPTHSIWVGDLDDPHRAAVAADLPVDPVSGAKTTLDIPHTRPWGWRVITYLWAKGLGGGALMIASLGILLGVDLGVLTTIVAPALGVAGTAVTGALLVWDLKRPERFLYILLKSNFGSWLVLGAYALAAHAAVSGVWLLYGIGVETGLLTASEVVWTILAVLGIPAGVMVAGYTAFLFGQAEGRDLWQSPLLFWHLNVAAVMVGAGALAVAALIVNTTADGAAFVARFLAAAAVLHVLMLLLEYGGRHASRAAAVAAHMITHGRYAIPFWTLGVALAVVAAAVAFPGWNGGGTVLVAVAVAVAGVAVQVALLAYETVFVRAGQDVPLS